MINEKHQALIERAVDGTLTDDDRAALAELSSDAVFSDALTDAMVLKTALEEAPSPEFRPYFEARTLARLKRELSPDSEDLLWRMFPRISIPAGALAAFLLWGNVAAAADGTPIVEAMFGLPSAMPDIQLLIGEDNT